MPKFIKALPILALVFVLSGCLNSGDDEGKKAVSEPQIKSVQEAVDQFQKQEGVLPIKTRDQKTPHYLKYPIDFNRLKSYLPEPPSNAYEEGGVYSYVIVDAEDDPTVKLADMRIVNKVQELQRGLNVYRSQHNFSPIGKVISDKRYTLDYKKIGYDHPPIVKSPFSGDDLNFVVGTQPDIRIDYRKDLNAYLKKYDHDYKKGDDIRDILWKHSPFVPIYSLPYTIKDNEPIFLLK